MTGTATMALGIFGEEIRVRGLVQGVGFRPTVYRLATDCGLRGEVRNDGAGVLIRVWGSDDARDGFAARLRSEAPPLSRIDAVDRHPIADAPASEGFIIVASAATAVRTGIVPDAATCPACLDDIMNPFSRRYRYPFTNCTHCGPRLSIIEHLPYDRPNTSMAPFNLCPRCRTEYDDPADRRFHAQPNACGRCGPTLQLERMDGRALSVGALTLRDPIDAARDAVQKGFIVAIKGLGGFHLACDATNANAVDRLRARKRRYGKPFALMARDLAVIRRYARVGPEEEALLSSREAPIVLLDRPGSAPGAGNSAASALPDGIAPGLDTIGFMLPYTPLHHLVLRQVDRPVVMTSGNISHRPQIIDGVEAREALASIADMILDHDRAIVNRVDDSVVRVMAGKPRLLRRARGYAPAPLPLPSGFEAAPPLIAMGAELKNTFCLVRDGQAIVSQHQGDMEDVATAEDAARNLALYEGLFEHGAELIAVDGHPEYIPTKLGRARAEAQGLPVVEIRHHHAHVASVLAENGWPLDGGPVLGITLDGLGMGDGGELWGGEFLLADYRRYRRLGTFRPVALIGGDQAARFPWRSTLAHIQAVMGWTRFRENFGELEICRFLETQPVEIMARMIIRGVQAPPASSCGRLFDAVAAAIGICSEDVQYEGQAAAELEALVDPDCLANEDEALAYPFAIPLLIGSHLPYVEPLAMWQALLRDLKQATPAPVMAARFHKGLARTIVDMVAKLVRCSEGSIAETVALSGGCFQNRVLLEQVVTRLDQRGFTILTQSQVPANDGGLSLGQAAIAAAQAIE